MRKCQFLMTLGFLLGLLFFWHNPPFQAATLPFRFIYQANGTASGQQLGYCLAGGGDLNGDGLADLLAGTHSSSTVLLFAGPGTFFMPLYGEPDTDFGFSVAWLGDLDGDGRDDFIVGAPHSDPEGLYDAGSAFVYSGDTRYLLYRKDGAADYDALGWSVAGAGDVDGDGKNDFMVGVPFTDPNGLFHGSGSVFVYSGATGNLLYRKDTDPYYLNRLGYSMAGGGEMDGDGKAEFMIGNSGVGEAYVYSGATGALIHQIQGDPFYGSGLVLSLSGLEDVDGDDRSDFIIGSPLADPCDDTPCGKVNAGLASVYSGATGELLYQIFGAEAGDQLGYSMAGAGDLDGDGRGDFIIGVPNAYWKGKDQAGSAFVYSGATGNLLYQINGSASFNRLGWSVTGAGDVNGDGRPDVAAGVPFADPSGRPDAGSVVIYAAPIRGDLDGNGVFNAADFIRLLNCVFVSSQNCAYGLGDVNCDALLDSSDLVALLNRIYLQHPIPCP